MHIESGTGMGRCLQGKKHSHTQKGNDHGHWVHQEHRVMASQERERERSNNGSLQSQATSVVASEGKEEPPLTHIWGRVPICILL